MPRMKLASRKTSSRKAARRGAAAANKRPTRKQSTLVLDANVLDDSANPIGLSATRISLRIPSRQISFNIAGEDRKRTPADWVRELRSEALKWTYVVRSRARWSGLEKSSTEQAARAHATLLRLGLTPSDLDAIAAEGAVTIVIPFVQESDGWEARIFPWEHVIASATSKARNKRPITITRELTRETPSKGRTKPRATRRAASPKILFVQSAPGALQDDYSFETEQRLVQSSLRAQSNKLWDTLINPTSAGLEQKIQDFRPDIIHLAGFDSHQGLSLLSGKAMPTEPAEGARDGYLLVDTSGQPDVVAAERLASLLTAHGTHRPTLISFSIYNSAARLAPLAVASGAAAAIGIQDALADDVVELFYGSFYLAWRKSEWDLLDAFRGAWDKVRTHNPTAVRGSGLVLWSEQELATKARRKASPRARLHFLPEDVKAGLLGEFLRLDIEAPSEINYSLLHNRQKLFPRFTLVNDSAKHNNDELVRLDDVDVRVVLSAGAEETSYQRRLSIEETSFDLADKIHLPLISTLMRSVNEAINTSLMVEVAWGRVLSRESHSVRLLPVDQWRDNDKDGQWLPSFVLPRDPVVARLIDKAQRYVRVLRDDPTAGFDGYQSIEAQSSDPTLQVDLQVQAIWSMIVHELNLTYINPPPTYSNEMDSQRLRTPSMIVDSHSGTCIDLALMFAACLELVDIHPVIFLLNDHAFPGYWRNSAYRDEFMLAQDGMGTDRMNEMPVPNSQMYPWWIRNTSASHGVPYREILQQVQLGRLVPLESVWLTETSGFWEAVDGGKENLKSVRRFHSMLDIARAREACVTPLPIGEQ